MTNELRLHEAADTTVRTLPIGAGKSDRKTLLQIAAALGISTEAAEKSMRRIMKRQRRKQC